MTCKGIKGIKDKFCQQNRDTFVSLLEYMNEDIFIIKNIKNTKL